MPDADIQIKIHEKDSSNNDIIQADFEKLYANLGHKKMAAFKWAFKK